MHGGARGILDKGDLRSLDLKIGDIEFLAEKGAQSDRGGEPSQGERSRLAVRREHLHLFNGEVAGRKDRCGDLPQLDLRAESGRKLLLNLRPIGRDDIVKFVEGKSRARGDKDEEG